MFIFCFWIGVGNFVGGGVGSCAWGNFVGDGVGFYAWDGRLILGGDVLCSQVVVSRK